jgi:hypothetical protein
LRNETAERGVHPQQATVDGWDRSRAVFERAARQMKEAWNKYHPNDQ